MVSNTVSKLPRFNVLKRHVPLAVFDAPSEVSEPVAPVTEPAPVESVTEDVPTPDETFRDAGSDLQQDVRQALEHISIAVRDIETSATAKVSDAICRLADELFPRLSPMLLAEEFASHIPDLVRLVPPVVRVEVSPAVAEQLSQACQSTNIWPDGWEICPIEDLEETRIEVSWEDGGLTYDTDKILASCLGRLRQNTDRERET